MFTLQGFAREPMDMRAGTDYAASWRSEGVSGAKTMTEAEWSNCTDPGKMLRFIWPWATDRKLRLFQCAWCRRMPYPLPDPRSRMAVETGERYVEGLVAEEERQTAWEAAQRVVEDAVAEQQWEQAAGAADARRCIAIARDQIVRVRHPSSVWHSEQIRILRELLGPLPFRSVLFSSSVLSWNDGTIRKLAEAIYEGLAFDRLPILADALEEAGCQDANILGHCRSGNEHVRGCWVVDALLGKS